MFKTPTLRMRRRFHVACQSIVKIYSIYSSMEETARESDDNISKMNCKELGEFLEKNGIPAVFVTVFRGETVFHYFSWSRNTFKIL